MPTRANELFDQFRKETLTTSSALLKACIRIEELEKDTHELRADLEREVNTSREKSYVILSLEEKLKNLRAEREAAGQ